MRPAIIVAAGWVLVLTSTASVVLSAILVSRARRDATSVLDRDPLEMTIAQAAVHRNYSRLAISITGVVIGLTLVAPVSRPVRDAALIVAVSLLWLLHLWSAYVWRRRIERLLIEERGAAEEEANVFRLSPEGEPPEPP